MKSTENENKRVMARFVEFINSGDRALGAEIIAPDVVFHAPTSPEPLRGLDGYVAVLDLMRGAMPDVRWTVEEMLAEDDRVMIRFTMQGTHTRPFMGMPATGRSVRIAAMNLYRLDAGRIVGEYGLPDLFSMLVQLGALPLPAAE